MTDAEALKQFGLPSHVAYRSTIRAALAEAMQRPWDEHDLIKCLTVLLFSIRHVEDSLIIWQAKSLTMDLGCSIDVQLLCGAGVDATWSYLSASPDEQAAQALGHLGACLASGDFENWTVESWLSFYQDYYEGDDSSLRDTVDE
jgi:hypothetical protein